ncbi:MAG: cation:dicarboxylase symporter family transporter [Gemmatimonadales bacterium]
MRSPAVQVLAAFVIGLAGGTLLGTEQLASWIEPVGTMWINAIRMPILPLLFALTVVGVGGSSNARDAGRLTARAFLTFVVLLTIVTAAATVLAPLLLSGIELDPASTAVLRESVAGTGADTPALSLVDWATNLITVNPMRSAAEGALLPLMIFALLYGLALTRVGETQRSLQLGFFRGVADTLTVIIEWVLLLAPAGVFALAFVLGTRVGAPAAGAVAWYLAVASALVVVVMLLLYVLMMTIGRQPLRPLVAALAPAQLIALSSRSSLASLPALIDGMQQHLRLRPRVIAVVLPLAAAVFKINAGATWAFGAVFVAKLYGVSLGAEQLVILAFATVLLSFTTPGIPSGGFFVQAPLYVALGLPVEGLGVLIAVDLVLDMFKTACNVTGFAAAAVLVAPGEVVTGS